MAYTCQNQSLRIPIQPIPPALLFWIWAAIVLVFTLPMTAQAQTVNDNRAAGIEAFSTTLYPALREEYCAGCHIQLFPPLIANDDVAQAYDLVFDHVNLSAPDASGLVTKVAGGHNCTPLSVCAAVADKMRTAIADWAGILAAANETPVNTVLITEPVVEEPLQPIVVATDNALPGETAPESSFYDLIAAAIQSLVEQFTTLLNTLIEIIQSQLGTLPSNGGDPNSDPEVVVEGDPDVTPPNNPEETPEIVQEPILELTPEMVAEAADMQAFSGTVYPLLRNYCAGCHGDNGPFPPLMAHSNLSAAYHAVVDNQKVNLNVPLSSRLVQQLADLHNCWDGVAGCPDNSETMRLAIVTWADQVGANANVASINDTIVTNTLTLADAGLGAANARYDTNIIARYEFTTGTGTTALDTSNVGTPINLELSGTEWIEGGGIKLVSGKATSTPDASRKLYDMIAGPQGSNEYSVEAWIVPENLTQTGPARIISYSQGTSNRNFTVGQRGPNYIFRNRTPNTGNNGSSPELRALNEDLLQTNLQHVVMTFDPVNGRRIYVNGEFTGDVDPAAPGSLTNWNSGYTFLMGNETTNNRLWKGEIHFAAIFNQALTPEQVSQNFNADLGQTYLLQFDTSAWVGIPDSYIEMEIREFGGFSYLLSKPTFFGLNPNNIPVKNIRIAVNGNIPITAQAFTNIDTVITSTGQLLSPQGSVIAKELGVEQDGFSLVFEVLGDFQMDIAVDNNVALAPVQIFNEQLPVLGIRNFDQINNTMAALTGVDPNTPNIRETFDELRQQLPVTYDLRNLASAHQVAHFKLALEYAQAMVGSNQLRDAFFGFSFNPDTAFSVNQGQTDAIVNRIVDGILNIDLANQPNSAEVKTLVKGLIATLPNDKTALEAAIATVLSSAATLII